MSNILTMLLFLPLVEIAGFITIGGEIGFLASMAWLIGATWLGFGLLHHRGRTALTRAQRGDTDEVFVVQDMFDGFCILIASVLLIFPGFISDFIAVPFLIAPLRHYVFERIRNNPQHPARRFAHNMQGKSRAAQKPAPDIIEGEYKTLDEGFDKSIGDR